MKVNTTTPLVKIAEADLQVLARSPRTDFTLWHCYVVPPAEGNWTEPECWSAVASRVKVGDLILVSARDKPFWTMLGVAGLERKGDIITGVLLLDVLVNMTQMFAGLNHPGKGTEMKFMEFSPTLNPDQR